MLAKDKRQGRIRGWVDAGSIKGRTSIRGENLGICSRLRFDFVGRTILCQILDIIGVKTCYIFGDPLASVVDVCNLFWTARMAGWPN